MNTNNIEKRCWNIETRANKNEAGEIVGMIGEAAVAGVLSENLGGFREIMEDGAFEKADLSNVTAKFNHNNDMVLGRTKVAAGKQPTLRVLAKEQGLFYEVPTIPATTHGNNLKVHLERGEIDRSSFAFSLFSKEDGDDFDGRVFHKRSDGQWIATIKRGGIKKVYDVSPVWDPAYTAASVSPIALRSLELAKNELNKTMKTKNTIDQYFKVITSEDGGIPEILLYGYIGQDFWWDDDLKDETITDLSFKKELNRLEKDHKRINIRINSPGGSMYHGNAIVSAIQNSKSEIHIYNDGMAASMAADIWLAAGKGKRHTSKNALLMIHPPSSIVWGTAKEMREEADVLDKFEHTAIAIMEDTTDLTRKEIKEKFYDGSDHWLTAEECEELGFVDKVEDYKTQAPLVEDDEVGKITHTEVVKRFGDSGDMISKRWANHLTETNKIKNDMKNTVVLRIDADLKPLENSIEKAERLIDGFMERSKEKINSITKDTKEGPTQTQENINNEKSPTDHQEAEKPTDKNEAAKQELLKQAEEVEIDVDLTDYQIKLLELEGEFL